MTDQLVNIIGLAGMALMVIVFYMSNKHAQAVHDAAVAAQKDAAAAAWALDYHNPASSNFDAAKVSAEQAQAAADWAANPRNPDSPNYDPNA